MKEYYLETSWTLLHPHWKKKMGNPEEVFTLPVVTLSEIKKINSTLIKEFIDLMMNRLAMGYFRYGPLDKQPKGKYDVLDSIRKRLAKYEAMGNDEVLVDCANLCFIEFLKGVHPNKHFSAEDDAEHTQTIKSRKKPNDTIFKNSR